MTSVPESSDEWKSAGDSTARHYSGSRQIALPAAALEVSDLTIGDTVSLAVKDGSVRAFSLEGWTQQRRVREQGASVLLPMTKRVLEAADWDTTEQDVTIEARDGELRLTAKGQRQEVPA